MDAIRSDDVATDDIKPDDTATDSKPDDTATDSKPGWKITREQNREVWAHVHRVIARERRARNQKREAEQAVAYCREALKSDQTDWDVIQYIKYVIRHYGL